MDKPIPHLARVQQEIREVFLNARFVKPEGCTGPVLEAYVCPGHVLVILHDEPRLCVSLGEDWTGVAVHTEVHLDVANPDWGRFQRWLWESCYEEVRQIVASVCKALGISVPWPEAIEVNGRKHFPGREPLETSHNLFLDLSSGEGTSHLIVGLTGSGKTSLAMRFALDAIADGKSVLYVSMEASTTTLVNQLTMMNRHLPPEADLRLTSLSGQGIGSVLKQCEGALTDRDVLILDSTFAKFEDTLKRLAMKAQSEIFATVQAGRGTTEQTCLDRLPKRTGQTIDAVYWAVSAGAPFKVLKHHKRGGSRLLYVDPP